MADFVIPGLGNEGTMVSTCYRLWTSAEPLCSSLEC